MSDNKDDPRPGRGYFDLKKAMVVGLMTLGLIIFSAVVGREADFGPASILTCLVLAVASGFFAKGRRPGRAMTGFLGFVVGGVVVGGFILGSVNPMMVTGLLGSLFGTVVSVVLFFGCSLVALVAGSSFDGPLTAPRRNVDNKGNRPSLLSRALHKLVSLVDEQPKAQPELEADSRQDVDVDFYPKPVQVSPDRQPNRPTDDGLARPPLGGIADTDSLQGLFGRQGVADVTHAATRDEVDDDLEEPFASAPAQVPDPTPTPTPVPFLDPARPAAARHAGSSNQDAGGQQIRSVRQIRKDRAGSTTSSTAQQPTGSRPGPTPRPPRTKSGQPGSNDPGLPVL